MKRPRPILIGAFLVLVQFAARGDEAGSARRSPQARPVVAQPAREISFRGDVAPVLSMSCSTRSCHGGGSRPPVLDARADRAAMRAALVGVAAEERPDRDYVRPGEPDASYLLQKIDGQLLNAECTDHDCGAPMPLDNPPLSEQARAAIRTWVAQGARDN